MYMYDICNVLGKEAMQLVVGHIKQGLDAVGHSSDTCSSHHTENRSCQRSDNSQV